MRRTWLSTLFLVSSLAAFGAFGSVAACSSSTSNDADAPNAEVEGSTEGEGGERGDDAAPADGGTKDAPSEGSTPTGDILGTLASGACGIVKNEITTATPSLENNVLVFVAGEKFEKSALSAGGQRLFDTPNAGGSSGESEVMSFEVLHYCEGATLLKTETEVTYAPPGDAGNNSITDILVDIGGKRVGVSVTRAYKPPTQPPMSDADVKALLEKKLEGIINSSKRVLAADKWVKQILHVFSVDKAMTDAIARVWPTIDGTLRADTVVLVTQTKGGGFVYCNNSQSPPLGAECQ